MPDDAQPAVRPTRKRHVLPRRWSLRVLLTIALLLIVAVVVTQIVLWTNLPRDLVLTQLEKQLGLRVSAASLSTGWLGTTELRDVTIGLPLASESLLSVPSMRVRHNTLFGLAWSRAVELDAIELDNPDILVRQDDAGRWNVQEVADLLARTAGKQSAAEQAEQTLHPKLPALRIRSAKIKLIDRAGRVSVIEPLDVTGDPENELTWKYEATAGNLQSPGAPGMNVKGRLAPGGVWAHEVSIRAARVERWASVWTGNQAPPVSFAANWRGEIKDGTWAGRLVVEKLDISDIHASGALAAGVENGALALHPESVIVHPDRPSLPDVRLVAGKVALDAKSAAADGLMMLGLGGTALVSGRYDWSNGSGDIKANWTDFTIPRKDITSSGSFTGSIREPFPGKPVVEAHLISTGKSAAFGWDADLVLGGTGREWRDIDWDLKANRLSVSGPQPVTLDGLAAGLQTRGQVVSLTSLHGPGNVTATGRGQYDLASHNWSLRLDLSKLPRPVQFGTQQPLTFTLNSSGTPQRIVLEKPGISLRGEEAELRIDGSYVYNIPKPVNLNVYVNNIPSRARDEAGSEGPGFGYLNGEAHLVGTALPTDLDVTGHLVGRDLRILGRSLGEVEADVKGDINDDRLLLKTSRLNLLGGTWEIGALFPDKGVIGMDIKIEKLPLKQIGAVVKQPDMQGTLDAQCALLIPPRNPSAVKATVELKASDVKAPGLAADQLQASVVLADGNLRVDPIRLRKGDGQANLTAELDLREFRRLSASAEFAAWPFEPVPGTKAELWGGTSGLQITLAGATREEGVRRRIFVPAGKTRQAWVSGPIDLRAALTLNNQPAGDVRVLADLRGRMLDLRSLSYDGLGGNVQGQGIIDFEQPYKSRGSLFFEDVDAERVAEFFPKTPALVGLTGRFGGHVRLGPAPGPRPLAPVRIQAEVHNKDGKYRSIDVGPIFASAFTNFDRLVVDDSPGNPTTLELAGGLIRIWGRFSLLEPGDELSPTASMPIAISQVNVSFGGLDLNQIVHAFKPDADTMVGKLRGAFQTLAGTRPGRRPGMPPSGQGVLEKSVRRITADGHLELTESELANMDAVAFFYNALNVAPNPSQPVGHGNLTFHMEDGLLSLNNVHYFNRGTELRGIADIEQVWKMPDSPLRGTAVGTARPFRDVKLPFFSSYDLDTIFTALQGNLTTASLEGSVAKPVVRPLAFQDLGEGMRTFILGDFQKENSRAHQSR